MEAVLMATPAACATSANLGRLISKESLAISARLLLGANFFLESLMRELDRPMFSLNFNTISGRAEYSFE
jgi:hypothetical protein